MGLELEQTLVAVDVDSYNIAIMAPYIGPSIAVQTCYEAGRLFQKKTQAWQLRQRPGNKWKTNIFLGGSARGLPEKYFPSFLSLTAEKSLMDHIENT